MNNTLSLHERIAAFQAAYIRCIDTNQLESWPEFFLPQCQYTVTTADNQRDGLAAGLIWANNRAMLQDRISALRNANVYERHSYRHLVGLPFITGEQPATASCETPFMVARIMHDGHTDLYFTGVYHDEFDASGDALLLRSRVVVCDSSRVDTLLAVPL
ncbi:MAG: aromatic-ring-hydroxylating dioxygenase subunit beta [Serpentinimonas sp.]|uniref:aromatic-ring-hydroxylating dioxygenase subunit beta n=1 Tax=Hydrogenophaga taeniospiralis TaxID=65656 RepID=UPI001CFC2D3E|nr:aromatic-ring-hydroxylating dioxygenase subunit beta [Hydrogenophaga taeniospiralis]MDO8275190.1 aromatic-ring-hydroxylating dioxygenase subunit beta [Serpentinimonas sp.]UCU94970.1 aromatic-ring-hydroxylating dioxygenase subunit beta [Hydrogenophaga taeniospiralis]